MLLSVIIDSFAQDIKLGRTDPNYPKYIDSGNKEYDNDVFQNAKIKYAIEHPAFPMYINTGNQGADQAKYDREVEKWFKQNLFFPEFVDRGNPVQDKENWEKSKREWINRYPEKYKKLVETKYPDMKQIEQNKSVNSNSTLSDEAIRCKPASESIISKKNDSEFNREINPTRVSIPKDNADNDIKTIDYPQKTYTGNESADTENYKTQKTEWVKSNPEMVTSVQNPEQIKQVKKVNVQKNK
ncbi:MAG: hypothetical protein A2033_06665 [Bacteroidetes bacterium GWA2_31_9]|nr:MAG: hypothetical protein A2033_06665 [Bacteroidetes bacterium GWA2_31_9]